MDKKVWLRCRAGCVLCLCIFFVHVSGSIFWIYETFNIIVGVGVGVVYTAFGIFALAEKSFFQFSHLSGVCVWDALRLHTHTFIHTYKQASKQASAHSRRQQFLVTINFEWMRSSLVAMWHFWIFPNPNRVYLYSILNCTTFTERFFFSSFDGRKGL